MNLKRNHIELIYLLLKKEIRLRYGLSKLGIFWGLLNPVISTIIYIVIFGHFLKIDIENYPYFIITGLFPWIYMTNSISRGGNYIKNNIDIVSKTLCPKYIFPFVINLSETINFFISILLIFFVANYYEIDIWNFKTFFSIICYTFFLLFFTYPITSILSFSVVFVKDFEYLAGAVFQILFYCSPIIYSIAIIPDTYVDLYMLNPFANIIDIWRSIFFNKPIDLNSLIYLFELSIFFHLFNFILISLLNKKISDYL
jgi:lipopolysaccharide transport system permease protein